MPIKSAVVCIVMYMGEAAMMDGNLYRFGTGWFFTGIPGLSVAIADLMVILLSAVVTGLALYIVGKTSPAEGL